MNTELFIKYYEQGCNDRQIAQKLEVHITTIQRYRKKHEIPTKFKYSDNHKITKSQLKQDLNLGLSDKEIGKKHKLSYDTIYAARERFGLKRNERNQANSIEIGKVEKEILLGCLLGDGSLVNHVNGNNVYFSCEHGDKQKGYCKWKGDLLKSLKITYKENQRKTEDPRTGIKYKSATIRSPTSIQLTDLYNDLYKEGTKVISGEFMKDFTWRSLAIMFMDDGYKCGKTIKLSTNCFSDQDLNVFNAVMKNKFNLEFNIHANHTIMLKTKCYEHFYNNIQPFMYNELMYKLP